jgi:cell division septal protein FtsQ
MLRQKLLDKSRTRWSILSLSVTTINWMVNAMSSDIVQIERVRVRVLPDGRLTRKDAAAYLGVTEKTLAMWQLEGKPPRSVKVGGRRFYYKEELNRA